MLREDSSFRSPAMTSVSCSRRLTSVSARRFVSPGTSFTVTSMLTAEISVAIFAAITPDSVATGLTSNFTPYSLNTTEVAPTPVEYGIGSSPPATKRALPPLRHDSVGEASTTASPFCASRLIIEVIEVAMPSAAAKGAARARTSIPPAPSRTPPERSAVLRFRSATTPNEGPAALGDQRTPSDSSTSRRISTMRTSIAIIGCVPTRLTRLTTCG